MKPTSKCVCHVKGLLYIHFVISLKADRPYKATVVYNLATVVHSDVPRQIVVYHDQLYTAARGFDVAHAKYCI